MTTISRGSDFDDAERVARLARGVDVGVVSVTYRKDAERGLGLGLGTGGKSNDLRTGVEAVLLGLLCMGVGGGISAGSDSCGNEGSGMV